MSEGDRQKLIEVIQRIQGLHPTIQPSIDALRTSMAQFPECEMENLDASYWRMQILSDSLIKIRIFIENNFRMIETMGFLSLTRYIFELVVILKNLRANENFSFLYMQKMLLQQCEHFEDYADHIRSEIALYIAMGEEEKSAHDAVIEKHAKKSSAAMSARNSRRLGAKMAAEINRASSLIDEKLALKFALYSDDIAHNGYAFQAHLLETKVLGSVIKKAELARASYEKIKSAWLDIVDPFPLNFKKWNWKEMSKHVGMEEEYDFLYSYTSRLLHASPHSLTTDQKNLEDSEVLMFIKYIEQQIKWTMGYVDEVLGRRSIH